MFEHFDESARQCVVIATVEAQRLGHEELGTMHLLLGVATVDARCPGSRSSPIGDSAPRASTHGCSS